MKSPIAAVFIAAIASLSASAASTSSGFSPIDARVPVPPRPLVARGAVRLAYEIHVTNLSSRRTTLDAVDVVDQSAPNAASPLLHLEGDDLAAAMRLLGASPDETDARVLRGGRTALVFVWMTVSAASVPTALTHRFTLRVAAPDGSTSSAADDSAVVRGLDVQVSANAPRVIDPPLDGDHWLAANGPDNGSDHRRTLLALAGEGRIAQRYAIDWVRLFDDGRTFRGDPRDNASYRAFGARVMAVADGVVADTLDGLPENIPDPVARAVPITPGTASGNYIVENLGDDASAVYAHLQPGSLLVKTGDHVRRGQVLARVGNTGNSSEPHLHFHLSDRPHALDAEGLPYAFASFDLEADPEVVTAALRPLGGSLEVAPDGLASWKAATNDRRGNEIPLLNAIVRFVVR
jgi:murein DD-endopeptidase MepM/ murein hydrolase activator NlpD